jgi:hypothetical protein
MFIGKRRNLIPWPKCHCSFVKKCTSMTMALSPKTDPQVHERKIPWLLDRQRWGNGQASTLKFSGCWTGRGAATAWPPSSSSLAVGQAEVRQYPGLHVQIPWLLDRQKCGNGLSPTINFPGCWEGRGGAMAGLYSQVPWLLDRQEWGNGLASTLNFPRCWMAEVGRWPGLHAQISWLMNRQKCGNCLVS